MASNNGLIWIAALAACQGPRDKPAGEDAPGATCHPVCINSQLSRTCLPDGETQDVACDPAAGEVCDPFSGLCNKPCSLEQLGRNYIGCDYYPTVVANTVSEMFDFAIAVGNTWHDTATVTIDGGALKTPIVFDVAPNQVGVKTLPWVPELKTCMSSGNECQPTVNATLAVGGAYHLHSTRPVTVYQFNPLEYHQAFRYSMTNDAALLLPANAFGSEFVVASWPAWDYGWVRPGVLTVTAATDATTVTITTTTPTLAGPGAPAFDAGIPGTVKLARGDVLELLAFSGDLTGTRITSDHPVQVIAGHFCTEVPNGLYACDHLEDTIFPIETLAHDYIVASPAAPGFSNGKPEVVRIVAAENGPTMLTYDPPIAAPTVLADRGAFIEIPSGANSFKVTANKKILVAQYMIGEGDANVGDPSLTLAVTNAQFRDRYVFHAPTQYDVNYVTIIAPLDATIAVDGTTITSLTPVGASGFGVTRVELALAVDGHHEVSGNRPFGASVYGYGQYTSYWYPAGLNLMVIQ